MDIPPMYEKKQELPDFERERMQKIAEAMGLKDYRSIMVIVTDTKSEKVAVMSLFMTHDDVHIVQNAAIDRTAEACAMFNNSEMR